MFAEYLDQQTRCERQLLLETGESIHGDKQIFHVMRTQHRARRQSFANFLTGSMTYGDFFAEQESIRAAEEDQIADIEWRREHAAGERRASIDEACASAGGRWNGFRCDPELGDTDRRISCVTDGGTTSCNSQ